MKPTNLHPFLVAPSDRPAPAPEAPKCTAAQNLSRAALPFVERIEAGDASAVRELRVLLEDVG